MAISFRALRCRGAVKGFCSIPTGKGGIPWPRCGIQKAIKKEEMNMAKRILVPLDGSESAEAAATLAADLARSSGGHVRLLQVHPVPEHRVSSAGRVGGFAGQGMGRIAAEGRGYLETVGTRLGAVPTEAGGCFGEPAQEVPCAG